MSSHSSGDMGGVVDLGGDIELGRTVVYVYVRERGVEEGVCQEKRVTDSWERTEGLICVVRLGWSWMYAFEAYASPSLK